VEALNVIDTGTSILLAAHIQEEFHAETTLQSIAHLLHYQGKPASITFDRDRRLVGSPSGRDFPSALLRFLLCLGIQPIVCPPHRPDLNAFIERYHRSYNQECLQVQRPQTLQAAHEVTAAFVVHSNSERPNQALSCRNQPPRVAFPSLPSLPPVPSLVDSDAWLRHVHGQHFTRHPSVAMAACS